MLVDLRHLVDSPGSQSCRGRAVTLDSSPRAGSQALRQGTTCRGTPLAREQTRRDPLPEQIAQTSKIDLDEVIQLLGLIEHPISLDTRIDDEAHSSLADTLEDSAAPALDEIAAQHVLSEQVHRAMAFLPPRERLVITLRYGISDGRSRTLLEVGKELGISRERVRQLEEAALKRMRSHIGL